MDNTDKKLSELEDFLAESNKYVASVLEQLDENRRNMEAMGWTEERLSKIEFSKEDRQRAIKELKRMGYGDLFDDELLDPTLTKTVVVEPEDHLIKVSRKMRQFNMI